MTIRLAALADNTGGTLDVNGTPVVTIDGTGVSIGAGRRLAQIVTYQTGAVATGSTIIPVDNTVPQSNEGDQYMSLSITPTNILSTLEIDITFIGTTNQSSHWLNVALFQNAIADAIAVGSGYCAIGGGNQTITFKHTMAAGTLSNTVFKVRAGTDTAATVTFNGALFGGKQASRITIKEYLP